MFCRFYINFIFVYKMEKTLEEILLEQLDQPVTLKNGSVAVNPRTGEPLMPEEAICMSIVQKAMKGDIQAATYINNVKKMAKHGRKK